MPFWLAVAAATAGNLVGSLIAYGVGRRVSAGQARAWTGAGPGRCDALFSRHGTRAVFVARLLPLARTFVSLPAGHARIGIGRFVAMTVAGCAIWAAALVLAGMVAGSGWRALSEALGLPLLAVGLAAIAAALWTARGREN
jgi:membrane protein DedA with SNARE-associated domain